jgi:hypothetical protein
LGWYRKQNKMKWIRWGIDVRCGVYLVVRSWGHKSTRTMHEHSTWDKSHRIVLLLLLVACILMAACWWHQIDAEKISYDVERCVWLIDGWSSMVLCYHWVWTFQFGNADSSLNLFQAPKG